MTVEEIPAGDSSSPVVGKQLTRPIVLRHLLTDHYLSAIDRVFPLREADFMRLTGPSSKSKTSAFAALLLSALLGFLIGLGPKLVPLLHGESSKVAPNEWKAVVIWGAITLIVFVIGFCLPSERKKMIKKIDQHFKKTDSSYAVMRGTDHE